MSRLLGQAVKIGQPSLACVLVLIFGNTALGQAPPNDDFISSEVLFGASGVVLGTNDNASLEPSEPTTVDGFQAYRSVWYSWEAPISAEVTVSVLGDFDTQLTVLEEAGDTLSEIGESDSVIASEVETLLVNAVAGRSYWFRVSSADNESGDFSLTWTSPLPVLNDAFTGATLLSDLDDFGSLTGSNVSATMEEDERAETAGWSSGSSVWYLWEAPATGTFSIRASGDFDTQLTLFGGEPDSSLGDLDLLDESDPQDSSGDSVVTWDAIDGTSYWLRVTGYDDESGDFTLDWSIHPAFQPVYTFAASTGRMPQMLLQAVDGSSYGIASIGGENDYGTIFRISPSNEVQTLAEFTGSVGPVPGTGFEATLLQCRDGQFYGTARFDQSERFFTMTPEGEFTILYEFPESILVGGGLVQGSDGDFYGTSMNGGNEGNSTVFRISATGAFSHVASFDGPVEPATTLVECPDGSLFGTTESGGVHDAGTIFRVSPAGIITTLFDFGTLQASNFGPYHLIRGRDNNFYGTTAFGGNTGQGSVFQISPEGTYAEIVSFDGLGDPSQGSQPFDGLIQGVDGDFYGTTQLGGSGDSGTIFRASISGTLTTVIEFTGNGGANIGSVPNSLVLGGNGELYGTTQAGGFGSNDVGTAFRLDSDGSMTTLVDFASLRGGGAGAAPLAAVVLGSNGYFYGTTYFDGATDSGTVFQMTPAGIIERLAEFTGTAGTLPGRGPLAPLVEGQDENFYGVTSGGGGNDGGTVFRISPDGDALTLFEFDNPEGSPESPLTLGNDGHFYGTTPSDGADGVGTIFRITSEGVFTTLIEFTGIDGDSRGANPSALTLAGNGSLYGTTRAGGMNDVGTLFELTPEGVLITLLDFTGEEAPALGSAPLGALLLGSDGTLYGTTSAGGPQGQGTIFKISLSGEFTSLFAFGGNEAEDHGANPDASLVEGADGNFYGTAGPGGRFENPTVYMMTPRGIVTTFHAFQPGEVPFGPLVAGPNGDLYGVQSADDTAGRIYRMVFRGTPTTYLLAPPTPREGLNRTNATVRSSVNPRGALISEVRIEFGPEGTNFSSSVSIPTSLAGYQGITVGRTLENLEPGTTYQYRFRVSSDLGESVSDSLSFSTLAEPEVRVTAISDLTPTSVRLNGMVNARNFDSTVTFEYGSDDNNFSNTVEIDLPAEGNANPNGPLGPSSRIIRGNNDTRVSAQLAGLEPGRTYYYRMIAASAGGFAVSGQGSFRTLTPPVAVLGEAEALSTTRARVRGTVDPLGSQATTIYFEYWPEDLSVEEATLETTTPASVSGEGQTEVVATLTGLTQGTTYYYRVRAVGPGGTGLSEIGIFSLSLLSGLDQTFPDPPNPASSQVTVTLSPPSIGGWRFAGEGQWRLSEATVANLTSGDRRIEYRPVAGYVHPPSELISVSSGESIQVDSFYFLSPTPGEGTLTVSLKPDNLADPNVPEASRAQWRFIGETDWRNSGSAVEDLAPGVYLIESKPVAGRATPPTTSVTVEGDNFSALTLTYFASNEQTGDGPIAVSADASANEDLPLAFIGQIRSSSGGSTGFVVKRRVVATAGHVVFDDGSLSFVTDLQWLFQRHSPDYEPTPQTPRGFYLAAGYADARQEPGVEPGVGTPDSQNLDYAVLYFQEEAGRGGVAGFLASDAMDENEFLSSSAEKMLAGYPVDGVRSEDVGKIHATPIFNTPLIPAFGETWTSSEIYGLGGISGGPLFTRHSNGSFYPSAIYLGGAGQAVVRAIDSDVVELFLRAETSGNGGENNTGGGITHTSVAGNLNDSQPGAIRILLDPPSVNGAGAGWQLVPESRWRPSGSRNFNMSPGTYRVQFREVDGFERPAEQNITVTGGQLTNITFTYQTESVASPLETWRQANFGTTANLGDSADNADPDQDGATNINEYTAGTDPNSSADSLRLKRLTKNGSTFSAQCDGKAGRLYTLQRLNRVTGAWTSLPTQGPLTVDETISLTDEVAPEAATIYRVEVSLP